MSYWAEFAYAGAPGAGREGGGPHRSAWDSSSDVSARFMGLDTESDGGLRMSTERIRIQGIAGSVGCAEYPIADVSLARVRRLLAHSCDWGESKSIEEEIRTWRDPH